MKYTTDIQNQDILLDTNSEQVMMEWEKPYMEACINMLNPTGHVLEIGFGLGYSATAIQTYSPKSHTIIECDPVVIEKCKRWASTYDNIIIIEAKWQEVICTDRLNKYDEVFFDDFPNDFNGVSEMEHFQMNHRIHLFIEFMKMYHLNHSSKISAYISKGESLYNDPLWRTKYIDSNIWSYDEKVIDVDVSRIQSYHKSDNKAVVPLLTLL